MTRPNLIFGIISIGLFGYTTEPPPQSISAENCALAAEHSKIHNGRTLVIMQQGKVIYESYDNEWTNDKPHALASGTKSFFGPLAAAAVDDKLISFDELASDTITQWKEDPIKRRITIRQLLTFTSGLYPLFDPFETKEELAANDLYSLIVDVEMSGEPGQTWQYGNSHLIAFGEVLRRKLKNSGREISVLEYLKERLLKPLEIEVAEWMLDGKGNPVPSTGVKITARQWAKWGEFIRTGGKDSSGKQLISAKTLAECFKGTKPHGGYGMGWWLEIFEKDRVDLPNDFIMAAGVGKQQLYIIPSLGLTVVRQGRSPLGTYSNAEFLSRLLYGRSARPKSDG